MDHPEQDLHASQDDLVAHFNALIPFNALLGIEVSEITAHGAVAHLGASNRLTNHLGYLHASAIFATAEAASGAATTGLAGHIADDLTILAMDSAITYTRPARGALRAVATPSMSAMDVRSGLAGMGRVEVDMEVQVGSGAGTTVATARFRWLMRRRRG